MRPYPGPGGAELVSLEGGEEPAWARDGRELFFRDGNRMMAIEVGDSEMFDPGLPRLLFEGYDVRVTRNYDVTRDGQRFLMVMSQEDQSTAGAEIRIVQNWFRGTHRARARAVAMPLSPGTQLGAYNVTAQIGAGGMGEVDRATDTKLNRDVALKVLPQAFTDDGDRPYY